MKSLSYAAATAALLTLSLVWAAAPVSAQTPLQVWMGEATAVHVSPVDSQLLAGDLTKSWTAPDGQTVKADVLLPRLSGSATTYNPGSNDMTGLAAAIQSETGGGQVNLQSGGTYYFNNTSTTPGLSISSVQDVLVNGNGATLIMNQWGTGITIANSQRLRIYNLTVKYAIPSIVTGSIVQIGSGLGLSIAPALLQNPGGSFLVYQVTTLNPTGAGYSITGNRYLSPTGGATFTSAGGNTYSTAVANDFTGFHVGDTVAIKLTYYEGAAVVVNDSSVTNPSNDITLDHVTVANSSGMGVVVDRMGRGFAVTNSKLGPLSLTDGTPEISYDGIHVSASAGDILLLSNQINGTGDDGVNLASPILTVVGQGTPANSFQIESAGDIVTGETIYLFDASLNYLGSGVETTRTKSVNNISTVSLNSSVPINTPNLVVFAREGSVLGSRFAVSGNTIENCDCHGTLAQLPNGIVSSNTYETLRYNAIRLITSGAWAEGTGALNVLALNNTISYTGSDNKENFTWAAITAYGEISSPPSSTTMTSAYVDGNIKIDGNTISNTQDACLSIADTQIAVIESNTCTNTMLTASYTNGFASYPAGGTGTGLPKEGIFIDPNTTTSINTTNQP